MRVGLKLHQGHQAGRDPREMSPEELREAGHEPRSSLSAIRAHCLDCCGDQTNEVALCTAVKCPSWPYRRGPIHGANPRATRVGRPLGRP